MSIGDTERKTQNRVIDFFKNRDILDYKYLGNLKDTANKNIREDRLRAYLRLCGYSERLIDGAVAELVKAADDMTYGLYDANHKVYSLLKYGAKVKETPESAPKTVYFIDVDHPTNNDFAIAEEVTVIDRQEKRPDLVIYVNGIAMAVIKSQFTLRLNLDDHAKIKKIAETENRSMTNMIETLVKQKIQQYEKENGEIILTDEDLSEE